MIEIRLYTGQILRFPNGTPESVIRAAAERATQAAKSRVDLSSLQGRSGEQVGGPKLQQDASLGLRLKQPDQPQPQDQDQLPERSPEYWRSVSGSPSSKAADWNRQSQLRAAEAAGAEAMSSLGFEDRETYYYNPSTDERVPKKRKTGNLPGPLDPGYRPESAADRLHAAYEMEGRPVPTSEELEARSEFARGVPSRVMGSMAGLVLPFQAAEAAGRGLKEEASNLATGDYAGRPTGEGLRRGVRQGWTESPITQGVAVVQEQVVEPARQRYLDAAIRAGMSPEAVAAAETGQMITGEVLNPGNYIGLEMLRTGAQMARTTPASLARKAAQESAGGARSIDEAGLVTREYGRGSALSEIEQMKAARSGEFLPGANEPLLYRDPSGYGGYKWKGVIPDAIREVQGKPWRTYRNVDMEGRGLGRVPLERPAGPEPRPRNVEGRQPLSMEVAGGTVEDQARIGGLWDYASKRYPTIASRVKRLEIGPDPFFDEDEGLLVLSPDSNLGAMMHELTHVAQAARGKLARDAQGYPVPRIVEPAAMRADDVYSRIPQPPPRELLDFDVVERLPRSDPRRVLYDRWVAGEKDRLADEVANPPFETTAYNGIPYHGDPNNPPQSVLDMWEAYVAKGPRWLNSLSEHEQVQVKRELGKTGNKIRDLAIAPEQPPYTFGAMMDEALELPVARLKSNADRPAPIAGVERRGDDSIVLSFDIDNGRQLTADEVNGLFPDLPEGYRIELGSANSSLRPNLQRVRVTFWRPDDPRVGAGQQVADDFLRKLGGEQEAPFAGMDRALKGASDALAEDAGMQPGSILDSLEFPSVNVTDEQLARLQSRLNPSTAEWWKSRPDTGTASKGTAPDNVAGGAHRFKAGKDISERFESFLRDNGIDQADSYYDLPKAERAKLDRQFAANDSGPDTVAWSAYLLEHNLRPDDYTALSLADRAKLETDFRLRVADQAPHADPDTNLPDYFYDANSGGWKVEGSDQVFEKEWQAQQHRNGLRVYADDGSRSSGAGNSSSSLLDLPVSRSGSSKFGGELTPRVPRWAADHREAIEHWDEFLDRKRASEPTEPYVVIDPEDVPFDIVNLPIVRFQDPPRGMLDKVKSGLDPGDLFNFQQTRIGKFYMLGDQTAYLRSEGGNNLGGTVLSSELYTPKNPLILGRSKGFDASVAGDNRLVMAAEKSGHDAIIVFNRSNDLGRVEVIKTRLAGRGQPRDTKFYDILSRFEDPRLARGVIKGATDKESYDRAVKEINDWYTQPTIGVFSKGGVSRPPLKFPEYLGDETMRMLKEGIDRFEQGAGTLNWKTMFGEIAGEPAGPANPTVRAEGPFRAYADTGLDPRQPIPAAIAPALPEEQAARAMGWLLPDGSPSPAGPTTRVQVPEYKFQTNIAAQLGGADNPQAQQVANYIIQQSDEVYRAIGPPQSWDTLEELAARAGTSKEDLLANSSHWNVMSPELRLRLLYVIKGNEEKIGNLQSKLVAGTATDTDKADLLRLIDSRGDMVRLAAKTGSAYGRALNSLRMEARLAFGEDHLLRQQLYRQYSKQIDADKPLLDALARLDPSNPEELQTFLRAVNKPSFREYLQEYWVASILSGPATHERNLIGNAVNAVMENAVVRPLAAGFDAARVAGVAGADRAIYLSETPAAVLGLTRGIRQGMRRGWEVLRRGYDPETMKGKLFPVRSAYARSQNRVVREVVGPVVTMPLRMLAASDALFKTMNHTAEIYAQAARAASKAGLSGGEWAAEVGRLIANPTDEMIEAADSFALKATFNDEASALGKAIMNLRDLPGLAEPKSAIGKAGVETYRGIAGFVLPFIKIADRLMVRGFEYTPIGTLKSVGARQAGNFVESADLAARSAIGSVVMAYAASLAMEGRLTAAAPSDEAEKAAFFGAGKQAWSVRTDDGLWIPYGGLQPVGTPFAMMASFWKGWTENAESPTDERIAWGAQQVGQYVTDQSYMDGLSKLIEAISGGKGQAGRAGADMLTNTAWGFAPYSGLTRSIAKGVDPRVIEAEHVADRLWQNVPGVSLGMDARLTPWGEEVVPVGGRLRAGLAPGSILLPSKEKSNPLDQELERLGMPLGYVGKTLSDKLGKGKSRGRWKLTPDEWYYYQQTAGRTSRKLLERLYSKPGYGAWDIERQREETEKAIGAAREYARIQTVRRHRGLGHV